MSDTVIRVDSLSKSYIIGHQLARQRSFRETLSESGRDFIRRLTGKKVESNGTREEFWALKDISFAVKRGECMGIIGRNGAGKSTLLKILSRITEPTAGSVVLKGRVASLLEVGTGFHPELTGRENIFLNGAILGMRRDEIRRKFDEIVSFAETEKFLDTPVKHYSSGMYMRLAFAVAAHLEPEILVVDEVLSVGDSAFQKKCLGKIEGVAKEGRTVLFVSHNMPTITRLCKNSVWLDGGKVAMVGPPSATVARYLSSGTSRNGSCIWPEGRANRGVDEFKFLAIKILNTEGEMTSTVEASKPFKVKIDFRIEQPLFRLRVGFAINTPDGIVLFETYDADLERYAGKREPGDYTSECEVPGELLNKGSYSITLNAGMPGVKNLAFIEGVLELTVEDTEQRGSWISGIREGLFRPALEWNVQKAQHV